MGQYHHDQRRLSTGHGNGALRLSLIYAVATMVI